MKFFLGSALGAVFVLSAPPAIAQEFCANVRSLLNAAPTEFATLRGAQMPGPAGAPNLRLFEGKLVLPNSSACVIAEQEVDQKRFSTGYTCTGGTPDTEAGMQSMLSRLRDCLDVREWADQGPTGGNARVAQYGLFRLSITRNGSLGLALGIEAFRDPHGEVMGSPTRGNRTTADGKQRCTPKQPEEITAYLAEYGRRPGAQRFEQRDFIGYTNKVSSPVVAFATRPSHPAHPAIITREVFEKDGSVYMSASGDFAGDCEAFHTLLEEVTKMNASIGRQ